MPHIIQDTELQVVVQFGGSSGEQYLHAFPNEKTANQYIRKAGWASYRCLGPFPVYLPGVRQLADAAKGVIAWLETEGLAGAEPARKLANALADVQQKLPLR